MLEAMETADYLRGPSNHLRDPAAIDDGETDRQNPTGRQQERPEQGYLLRRTKIRVTEHKRR